MALSDGAGCLADPIVESGHRAALGLPPTTSRNIKVGSLGGLGWRYVVPRSTEGIGCGGCSTHCSHC